MMKAEIGTARKLITENDSVLVGARVVKSNRSDGFGPPIYGCVRPFQRFARVLLVQDHVAFPQ